MSGFHQLLAIISTLAVLLVGIEAALRTWRGVPASQSSIRLASFTLILLGVTSASGLGILVGGARPHQMWHLMYGGLAFAALPVADSLAIRAPARARGLATLIGAGFALSVIARLFVTG